MKLAHASLCTIQDISGSWLTLGAWALLITCEFSLLLPKLLLVLLGPKVWSAVYILICLLVLTKPLKPHIPFLMSSFVFKLSQWEFSSHPENLDGYMDLKHYILSLTPKYLSLKYGNMLIPSQSHKGSQLSATLLLNSLVLSSWIRYTSLPRLQGTTQEASLA